MIAQPESTGTMVQALPRVMSHGAAREIDRESSDYEAAKRAYLERHPRAEVTFDVGDFSLFAIEPRSTRYVASFGRAYDLEQAELPLALRDER